MWDTTEWALPDNPTVKDYKKKAHSDLQAFANLGRHPLLAVQLVEALKKPTLEKLKHVYKKNERRGRYLMRKIFKRSN